jgi:hypothetical protein
MYHSNTTTSALGSALQDKRIQEYDRTDLNGLLNKAIALQVTKTGAGITRHRNNATQAQQIPRLHRYKNKCNRPEKAQKWGTRTTTTCARPRARPRFRPNGQQRTRKRNYTIKSTSLTPKSGHITNILLEHDPRTFAAHAAFSNIKTQYRTRYRKTHRVYSSKENQQFYNLPFKQYYSSS